MVRKTAAFALKKIGFTLPIKIKKAS